MKVKPQVKVVGIAVIAVSAFFGIKAFQNRSVKVEDLKTIGKVTIPDAPEASLTGSAAIKYPIPGTSMTKKADLLNVKWYMMAWQSQNGAIYANGGSNTTENSLFEQAGWNVQIERQDNCTISMSEMIKYCKAYAKGETKDGMFVTYMGSGIPNFISSMWNHPDIKELTDDKKPVAFLTFGKSYGEDQVIGTEEIRANKQLLKGKILRGVRLDGDIDLALKLCADNDIKVNPNPKLYFPDALNLSYVSSDNGSFLTAVQDYNASLKETRKLVVGGVTKGDTTVTIDLVATWTPGDVNAIEGRGGVTIVSTRDYKSIMPNITITSRKFLNDNREKVKSLILALAIAGDQIRSFNDVKELTCQLGAKVWNEADGSYWLKYYNGIKKGNAYLGGSMVFNLKDMGYVFGLDGTRDTYKDIYNTFGKLQTSYYPEDFPRFLEYEKAVDKSILRDLFEEHKEDATQGTVTKFDYTASGSTDEVVGSKSYAVTFTTGSAQITSTSVLNDIAEQIGASDGLRVTIEGHTDNVGSAEANHELSRRRAQAVSDYLVSKGIDANRFHVEGFGSEKPIVDNSTEAGRSKNRRVQILLTK